MKQVRETQDAAQPFRGYSLMPVGHNSSPLSCPAGQAREVAPGVFITVDATSGIALIETNPLEKKIHVAVDGREVMDVSQLVRGSALSLDGKDFVFLKYMDVFFNPSRPVAPSASPAPAPAPVRVLSLSDQKASKPASVRVPVNRSLKRVLKLALPALLITAGVSVFLLIPDRNEPVAPVHKVAVKSRPKGAAKPQSEPKAPETLRDLMAEAPVKPAVKTVEKTPEMTSEKTGVETPAIPIKPESSKPVKKIVQPVTKPVAAPAPQPALSPEVLKALTREYEEAVLIRGYDRNRSVQILEKLRKKVPAGSALRTKIDNALKG